MKQYDLTILLIGFLTYLKNDKLISENYDLIKYFFDNNINTLFEKNLFEENEVKVLKISNKDEVIIRILYDNMEYDLIKYDNTLVFENHTLNMKLFKISLDIDVIQNILVNIDEPNIETEIQKFNKKKEYYEYTKTIKCYDETIKYPIFKIKKAKPDIYEDKSYIFTYYNHNNSLNEKLKSLLLKKQVYKFNEFDDIFNFMKEECIKHKGNFTRK